jgi:hypothetical protein
VIEAPAFRGFSDIQIPIVGQETGAISGNATPILNETKTAVAGQDAGSKVGTAEAAGGEKKVKSEKERTEPQASGPYPVELLRIRILTYFVHSGERTQEG